MVLRMLREPGTGKPGPLARLVAVLILVALVAISAPVLVLVVGWVVRLL